MRGKMLMMAMAVSLVLSGFSHAAEVKIGVINSMTGPEAPIGESLTNAYKMAQEDLKAKGINVNIIWEDDTGKPQISMSAMEKLATRDNVAGVVGPYSSACANAVAKVSEKYKLPLLIPAATKEETTRQGYKWVFRLSATTNTIAANLIDMALSQGKPKSIAVIYENTDFGNSINKSAKEYAAKKGIKVLAEEPYSKGAPDYRSTLTKIKSLNPDLVMMSSYVADAILLMRQAREIGLQPQAFLGAGAGFATEQFSKEKEISSHIFSSTQWASDVTWPGAKEFARRYQAKFGRLATYHAACAYESMIIMAETVAKSGGKRDGVRAALKAGKWSGIMGDVKFEDYAGFTNQNNHQILVEQIQNGKYSTVFPVRFATNRPVYPFPKWK